MIELLRLQRMALTGYRPFKDFNATFGPLEVIVGANGSGKSALFEFLRFLRDSMSNEIPPEIIPGGIGQQVFHVPGPEQFEWGLRFGPGNVPLLDYHGLLIGPLGRPRISKEQVETNRGSSSVIVLSNENGEINLFEPDADQRRQIRLDRPNRLALSLVADSAMVKDYSLRESISNWRFFSAFELDRQKARRGALVEQEPTLREDASNLNAVLHYLYTEYHEAFAQLEQTMRSTVPGFKKLSVKARGGPGEVIAFWQESGTNTNRELTLTDLSDGTLRLLCWAALCYQPNLPSLICIDEPDQGLHPRTLPVLAALLKRVSERTQVLVATHSSFLLTQFDLQQIAVMRKENGMIQFIKPDSSKVLTNTLDDFGAQEIEILHRSDELEQLA